MLATTKVSSPTTGKAPKHPATLVVAIGAVPPGQDCAQRHDARSGREPRNPTRSVSGWQSFLVSGLTVRTAGDRELGGGDHLTSVGDAMAAGGVRHCRGALSVVDGRCREVEPRGQVLLH